jgi:CHAD domain-containing protein
MLTKRKQKKYLSKKESDWMHQLQVYDQSRNAEALHRLRLDVKKIKAFLQLLKACPAEEEKKGGKKNKGNKAAKDFRPIKNMFRQAGKIRDAGNNLQLLERFHHAPETFKQEQVSLQSIASAEFLARIKEYRKKGKKANRRLLAAIQPIPVGCIRDWYAEQLISTGVLLTATGRQLHEARKKIKQLLHVLGLLPEQLAKELCLDTDYLDQLQDAIGKWHDASMALATWAGKDLADSQEMSLECRQREAAVRELSDEFYLRAHLS